MSIIAKGVRLFIGRETTHEPAGPPVTMIVEPLDHNFQPLPPFEVRYRGPAYRAGGPASCRPGPTWQTRESCWCGDHRWVRLARSSAGGWFVRCTRCERWRQTIPIPRTLLEAM